MYSDEDDDVDEECLNSIHRISSILMTIVITKLKIYLCIHKLINNNWKSLFWILVLQIILRIPLNIIGVSFFND